MTNAGCGGGGGAGSGVTASGWGVTNFRGVQRRRLGPTAIGAVPEGSPDTNNPESTKGHRGDYLLTGRQAVVEALMDRGMSTWKWCGGGGGLHNPQHTRGAHVPIIGAGLQRGIAVGAQSPESHGPKSG